MRQQTYPGSVRLPLLGDYDPELPPPTYESLGDAGNSIYELSSEQLIMTCLQSNYLLMWSHLRIPLPCKRLLIYHPRRLRMRDRLLFPG